MSGVTVIPHVSGTTNHTTGGSGVTQTAGVSK